MDGLGHCGMAVDGLVKLVQPVASIFMASASSDEVVGSGGQDARSRISPVPACRLRDLHHAVGVARDKGRGRWPRWESNLPTVTLMPCSFSCLLGGSPLRAEPRAPHGAGRTSRWPGRLRSPPSGVLSQRPHPWPIAAMGQHQLAGSSRRWRTRRAQLVSHLVVGDDDGPLSSLYSGLCQGIHGRRCCRATAHVHTGTFSASRILSPSGHCTLTALVGVLHGQHLGVGVDIQTHVDHLSLHQRGELRRPSGGSRRGSISTTVTLVPNCIRCPAPDR